VSDYLQRSARHIASETDLDQAYSVGQAAVEFALAGKNGVMPVIKRLSDAPYKWIVAEARLSRVANREKMMPKRFITKDGFGITPSARKYLEPLIRGEAYPPYGKDGLPAYVRLQKHMVEKKLPPFRV
jgi:6-phosphofructokinase 1